MATITATAASSIVAPRFVHSGVFSITGGPFTVSASSGDVIQMLKVPNAFKVKNVLMHTAATSGTAAMAITVGDGDDPNRFISASVSAAVVTRIGAGNPTANPFYTYTANDTVDITVASISGSDSAGQTSIFTLVVEGSIDD